MRKETSYLKLCNNPFGDKAKRFKRKVITMSVTISIIIVIASVLLVIGTGYMNFFNSLLK